MKLLWKFNLVFVGVFAVGLGLSGLVARDLLLRNAQDEVLDRARLMMAKAAAVMGYTAEQLAPLLEAPMRERFLPQSIPSYAAAEVLGAPHGDDRDYAFKQAMLNPTNPRDRALEWEADLITRFRSAPELTEFIGERDTPTGRSLYIAQPIRITSAACLRCHSTAAAAPRTLIERYGSANGFGWDLNETLGVRLVSVPMELPLRRAEHAWRVVMGLLAAVFVLIATVLNAMLWRLVIRRVERLSVLADRASLGDLGGPDFADAGGANTGRAGDEIADLAASFTRMRKSLVKAIKLLDP